MQKRCNVLILAAGFSRRMGKPKFMLPFDHSKTFYEKIIERYMDIGFTQIVFVANKADYHYIKYNNPNVKIVINEFPEKGRFYSIIAGLKGHDDVSDTFIHNVDNPFVIDNVLREMSDAIKKTCYAVPVYKGKGGHPVLLSAEIVQDIIYLPSCNYNLKEFLKKYNRINVNTDRREVLININTPADFQRLSKELQSGIYK
jgi:molybdenum cofactor cytidylyltransferase